MGALEALTSDAPRFMGERRRETVQHPQTTQIRRVSQKSLLAFPAPALQQIALLRFILNWKVKHG
jgi:hypothetical protein